MGSSEWEELLERRLAFLPGSRDPGGGPVLDVPLPSDPTLHDLGGISATLKYLKTIPSSSCRERGWVVIVDARNCPYRLVKPTVSTIRAALNNIRYLFVVRPDAFWEKQRVDCRKSEVDSQPIYISASKLFRYLEVTQLPEDFGGTLKYDHESWIRTRKFARGGLCMLLRCQYLGGVKIVSGFEVTQLPEDFGGTLKYDHESWIKIRKMHEEFTDECERVKRDLESLQTELRREEPCSRASTLQDLLSVNTSTYNSITTRPSIVFKMGEEVLHVLEMDEESGFKMHEALGFTDEACRRVRSLLQEVHLLLTAVQASWKRLQTALDMYHEVQGLETEMSDIGKWLVSAGQTLLTESRIGLTPTETESLLREHEAIELKCRETYARWARLRYRVEEAVERGEGELRALAEHETKTLDLRALKEYTDTLVRSFASRLDRRRTLILASVRFHRIVQQMEQRCSVLLEEKRWIANANDLQLLKKTIRELTARKETIDYLGSEGTKGGEKLLDLLTVGVKDLSGRDVTPDYSKELNHVHKLLKRSHDLYERTARQAEVARLRLQQAGQLMTCHQDIRQAQEWLQTLLEALVTSHSHVGRSIDEIRHMKNEHQKFQETAAGTFEYGYECARAALLVEKSGGSPTPSDSNKLIAKLEDTWKMFIQGSQEQLTRLRVAGIFFRTMEQHLCRLDAFTASVIGRTKTKGRRFTNDEEGRNLLATRDRLLREIGRNVRLGKLLKERMTESLVPYFKSGSFNENLVTQEAISERIHFITRRARHLDALMLPSTAHSTAHQPQTQPQQSPQCPPTPPTSSPPTSPLPPPPSSSPLLLSHGDSPLPPPPFSPPPLPSPPLSPDSLPSGGSEEPEKPHDILDQAEDFEVAAAASEYWTCSDCSCCGSFHTCDDIQDISTFFTRDGSQSLLDDETLFLEDLLCPKVSHRLKIRSRSLSPTRKSFHSRARCRSKSLSRSRERSQTRRSGSSSSVDSLNKTLVSDGGETSELSCPEGSKRKGPQIHPDGEARRKRSRSTSLTKEIVSSYLDFREKVLERPPSRSRSRSRSGSRSRGEIDEQEQGELSTQSYDEVLNFENILSSEPSEAGSLERPRSELMITPQSDDQKGYTEDQKLTDVLQRILQAESEQEAYLMGSENLTETGILGKPSDRHEQLWEPVEGEAIASIEKEGSEEIYWIPPSFEKRPKGGRPSTDLSELEEEYLEKSDSSELVKEPCVQEKKQVVDFPEESKYKQEMREKLLFERDLTEEIPVSDSQVSSETILHDRGITEDKFPSVRAKMRMFESQEEKDVQRKMDLASEDSVPNEEESQTITEKETVKDKVSKPNVSSDWKEVSSEKITTKVVLQSDAMGDQRTLTLEQTTTHKQPQKERSTQDVFSLRPISSPSSKQASATTPFPVPTTTLSPPTTTSTSSFVDGSTNYAQLGNALSGISQSVLMASNFMAAKALASSISQATLHSAVISATEIMTKTRAKALLNLGSEANVPIRVSQSPQRIVDSDEEAMAIERFFQEPLKGCLGKEKEIPVTSDYKVELSDVMINQEGMSPPKIHVYDDNPISTLSTSPLKGAKENQIHVLSNFGEMDRASDELSPSVRNKTVTDRLTLKDNSNDSVDNYVDIKFNEAAAHTSEDDSLPPRPPLPAGALKSLASIYARMTPGGSSQSSPAHLLSVDGEETEALSPFPPRPEPLFDDSDDSFDDEPLPSLSCSSFVRMSSPHEYSFVVNPTKAERESSSPEECIASDSGYSKRPLPTILEMSSSSSSESLKSLARESGASRDVSPARMSDLSSQLLQIFGSSSMSKLNSSFDPVESFPLEDSSVTPLLTTSHHESSLSPFCHSKPFSAKDLIDKNNLESKDPAQDESNESVLDRPVVRPIEVAVHEDGSEKTSGKQSSGNAGKPPPYMSPERLRQKQKSLTQETTPDEPLFELLRTSQEI